MTNPTITNELEVLLRHGDLTTEQAETLMETLFSGGVSPVQTAALLVALRMKGETAGEIAGFARAMRALSAPVTTSRAPLTDTCGTGGDACKTFNISTCAAIVAAASGANIAKHGNRAVTSRCGSADVLEALGVNITLSPDAVGRCLDEIGIGFLFARTHHSAMRHVAPVRAELGVRTVFNLLGPLTNPARASRQVIGVYSLPLCRLIADVLQLLGAEHALVVHGAGGLDEIALWGETHVAELRDGVVCEYSVSPAALGLSAAAPDAVGAGATASENAAMLRAVLDGGDIGPRRNIVLANAGAAIYVAGLADSIAGGVERAIEAVDSGAALAKLTQMIRHTNDAATAGEIGTAKP